MQPETEYEAGEKEVRQASRPQSAEEKVERKRKEERGHDGAESDARKIDGPVRGRQHKGCNKTSSTPVEEFFAEQVEAERRQCPENDRPELEAGDGVSKERDREGLKVDEESLAAEIGRIKKIEVVRLESVDGIYAVGRLIRIDTGGNVFDSIDPNKEGEKKYQRESDSDGQVGFGA